MVDNTSMFSPGLPTLPACSDGGLFRWRLVQICFFNKSNSEKGLTPQSILFHVCVWLFYFMFVYDCFISCLCMTVLFHVCVWLFCFMFVYGLILLIWLENSNFHLLVLRQSLIIPRWPMQLTGHKNLSTNIVTLSLSHPRMHTHTHTHSLSHTHTHIIIWLSFVLGL